MLEGVTTAQSAAQRGTILYQVQVGTSATYDTTHLRQGMLLVSATALL
jgi:hypothetical protein